LFIDGLHSSSYSYPPMPVFHRSSVRLSLPARALRHVFVGVTGALLIWPAVSHAEDRWVSDSLSTYVRSGPTDGYRIVGALKSGEKVTLLRTQGDYSQVRSANGDSVWIANKDLQDVPGQAERLPQLQQQVAELSEQLKTIDDSWKL